MPANVRRPWRLSSLRQLVLLSFLIVVIPFGVVIYYATDALVEQSAQGRTLAQQALEVTRRGQQLERLAEDITRSARQYQILAKPEIQERLNNALAHFREQLGVHSFVLENPDKISPISALLSDIEQAKPFDPSQLLQLIHTLNAEIDQILDLRLQALNENAQQTQTQLSSWAIALLVIELLMILFFSLTITRPVKRITNRIQAMGSGEVYEDGPVGGPDELVELEQKLDWLTARLAEVEQEKQRFLRHMSHELKTPLTTLREGSDLLADQVSGELNSAQMEIAELLQSNARQLQSLIEQLLDYNRLNQNEPLNLYKVALQPALREAIEPYQLLLEQKQIKVSTPTEELNWITDRAMLIRILANLVSNAALYGSEKGQLNIRISEQNTCCEIEIENQGPTIPAQDLPHLFEAFYQGQNRRLGPVKGSGIGLSIVRDAVSSLNAEISLNKNSNNTVCFKVSLPRYE